MKKLTSIILFILLSFTVFNLNGSTNINYEKNFIRTLNYSLPTVITTAISSITESTAISGGDVTNNGGESVTAKGVCWSTSQDPTIANDNTNDGSGTGSYTSNLTGLFSYTTYYVRAYATNSEGTSYGNQESFTTSFSTTGNALDFDGVNDYIAITNNTNLQPTAAFTLEAWVYIDAFTDDYAGIIDNGAAEGPTSSGGGYFLGLHTDSERKFRTWAFNGPAYPDDRTVLLSEETLELNKWYHVASVFNGSSLTLYINGVESSSVAISGSIDYTNVGNYGLNIGAFHDVNEHYEFDGKIDEARIWNDVRTETEIIENMCQTLEGNEVGLVAYYRMNQSSGTSIPDISGNGNTGTLTNMDGDEWGISTAFNTWLNVANSSWTTASSWSMGSIPVSTDNIGIPNYGTTQPIISTSEEINNIVIGEGATLNFNYNGSHTIHGNVFNIGTTNLEANTDLTITGSLYMLHNSHFNIKPLADLTIDKKLYTVIWGLTGTLTIESSDLGTGSLIVNETATGEVNVERFLTHDKWHYISGQTNIPNNFGTSLGLVGGKDKDQFYRWEENQVYVPTGILGTWVDILNGDGSGPLLNSEGFIACKGYAINYIGNDTILSLSGVPYTTNQSISTFLTPNSTNEGANLIGNPFTSSIALNTNADVTNNFITDNSARFADKYGGIYFWDERANWSSEYDYTTISQASNSTFLQPGQAFMVVTNTNGNLFEFNTEIRKHGSGTFYKNNSSPRINLIVKDSDNQANTTEIVFISGMTNGLDITWDAGKLKGNPNLALYTRLVNDNGTDFAIQALSDNNIEETVIPVGIDIKEPTIIEFNVLTEEMDQWPVLLEDKQEQSFTNLKEESYITMVDKSGIGRFFLHMRNINKIDEPANINKIKAYTINNTINIINPEMTKGQINVIDISGKLISTNLLTGDTKQQVSVNSSSGFFIVNISTEEGNNILNKVIICK